jgi:precorrin-6x reductase
MLSEKALEAAAWEGVRAMFERRHGEGTCPDSRLRDLKAANEIGETWEEYLLAGRAAITAYLSALKAEGLVIVPVEPTEAMLAAGRESATPVLVAGPIQPQLRARLAMQYRAMLSAHEDGK